jgi:uncharacterized protein YprB with RNaseH-like and TPR domain
MTDALKHRLGTLRRQAGATNTGSLPTNPSIAERVQRYRVERPPAAGTGPRMAPKDLAARMGGELIDATVVRIEQRIALGERHGGIVLERLLDGHDGMPETAGLDPRSLVFLDTETSGLAGGSGTIAFMLGLARIENDVLVVRQYQLTGFAGEAPMLEDAAAWLREAGTLVTFNGKCFDVPLLSARARLARMRDPCADMPHIDLLHPTRRAFARVWPDCRLTTAERELVGFHRLHDLPGSEAPMAWFDYLKRGDAGLLPEVARHNYWDLVSLAALLPALAEAHTSPAAMGADVLGVARAHLIRGAEERARALLLDGAHALDEDGLLELARLLRRRGDWGGACSVWERLAAGGNTEAVERLAKYHEHVRRDYRRALEVADQLPDGEPKHQRRQRLARKLRAMQIRLLVG